MTKLDRALDRIRRDAAALAQLAVDTHETLADESDDGPVDPVDALRAALRSADADAWDCLVDHEPATIRRALLGMLDAMWPIDKVAVGRTIVRVIRDWTTHELANPEDDDDRLRAQASMLRIIAAGLVRQAVRLESVRVTGAPPGAD